MTKAGISSSLMHRVYYILCIITVELPPLAKAMCLFSFITTLLTLRFITDYMLMAGFWRQMALCEYVAGWKAAAARSGNQPLLQLSSRELLSLVSVLQRLSPKRPEPLWVSTGWNVDILRYLISEMVDIFIFSIKRVNITRHLTLWL